MSSSDARYRAIPQAPLPSQPLGFPDEEDESTLTDRGLGAPNVPSGAILAVNFALGAAVLLPWNVLITATPYFVSRLVASPFQTSFNSYMSCSFTAANFIFLAHATATSKKTNPARQIIITLVLLSTFTLALTISTYFHVSPGAFFAFVLLNGITQAALGSYLQTSVVAVAALFGPQAVQAMIAGQAAVAVAVSSVQLASAIGSTWNESPEAIVALLASGKAEERSAFIFFALSTLFLLACVVMQKWMMALPEYQVILGRLSKTVSEEDLSEEHERTALVSGGRSVADQMERDQVLRVAKANWIYEVAIAYVFLVTLAVFPAISASVQPTSDIHPLLFSSIHFLMFGIGDLLGRYICAFPRFVIWSANRLLAISLLRTLFIPLFLLCNIPYTSSPIISSDIMFMLLLTALGLSNGYVSSLCMMAAPSIEHNPRLLGRHDDIDVAATVESFALVAGLALGSLASFLVRGLVCQCNPFTN